MGQNDARKIVMEKPS